MLTHEEIISVRVRAADFEKFHKIMKLAVDISANSYGAFLPVREQLEPVGIRQQTHHWLHI